MLKAPDIEIIDVGPEEFQRILEGITPTRRISMTEISKQGYRNIMTTVYSEDRKDWKHCCVRLVMPKNDK